MNHHHPLGYEAVRHEGKCLNFNCKQFPPSKRTRHVPVFQFTRHLFSQYSIPNFFSRVPGGDDQQMGEYLVKNKQTNKQIRGQIKEIPVLEAKD